MKKIIKGIIITIILITMTACQKNEIIERKPLEVLNDTLNNEQETKNIKIDLIADLKVNTNGMSIDTKISSSATIIEENENYKALIELSDNPLIKGGLKTYIKGNNKNIEVYIPSTIYDLLLDKQNENIKWIKIETEINEQTKEEIKTINIKEYLTEEAFYLINKNNNIGTYNLKISNELLNKIYKENTLELKKDLQIQIMIDEEKNRIKNITIDLMDLLNNLETEEYKETIEKFKIESKISYDNNILELPNEIIESAITAEEYIKTLN